MFSALANCLKIKEIRRKILFTFALLAICRVVAYIPVPGIDPNALVTAIEGLKQNTSSGGGGGNLVDMLNMFTGGALGRFAVGTLGIMPYITASIIMQLVTPIYPTFEAWKREGESGYQKINQATRFLTLIICVVQGYIAAQLMLNPGSIPGFGNSGKPIVLMENTSMFIFMTVIILTVGTLILMWLGEQITEHGVGQGASLIITVSIIERLPQAVFALYDMVLGGPSQESNFTWVHLLILIALFVVVCAGTVAISVGVRRVPIQYARMMAGRSGSPQASFFPVPINYANVMPVIFASAVMSFPGIILQSGMKWFNWSWPTHVLPYLDYGTFSFMVIEAVLIIVFTFFWVASQFNPVQIADDLKRSGAYIPGIRPGKPTSDYLDWCMTRITTAGALFLVILALLPLLFTKQLGIPFLVASFFGGTSLLIIVGVMLNTMRQLESLLLHYGYDSFLQHGRLRSRRSTPQAGLA